MWLIGWVLNWGCAAFNGYMFVSEGHIVSLLTTVLGFSVGIYCLWGWWPLRHGGV